MLSLVLVLCSAAPHAPGVQSFALLRGRLTFTAPAYWGAGGPTAAGSAEGVIFCIPNPASEGTPEAANVVVQVVSSSSPANLKAFSDSQLALLGQVASATVLLDSTAGGTIRIVARRSQQDATVFNLNDLFAVSGRTVVHCFIAIPNTERIPQEWYRQVAEEISGMLATIRLDGVFIFPDLRMRLIPR